MRIRLVPSARTQRFVSAMAVSLLAVAAGLLAQNAAPPAAPADGQAGSAVLPVVADACIAAYPIGARTAKGGEQANNAGAADKLKLKKFENRPILRFDFSALPANATVTEAELEITIANGKPINQVGVGTLHVPWNEGDGVGKDEPDAAKHTGACFLGPKGPDSRWLPYEEGDFNAVSHGNGGDATCVVKARSLGSDRWAIPVDPMVIHAARADGQMLVLIDETGLFGGDMTNAYMATRENKAAAPKLKVKWAAQRDAAAPKFKEKPSVATGPMAGSLILRLPAAGDDGTDGCALGYRVSIDGADLPITQLPRPNRLLRTVLLRDLAPGKAVKLVVTAYDEAGNTCREELSATVCPAWAGTLAQPPSIEAKLPEATAAKTFSATLTDGLTLIDPLTGKVGPRQLRSLAKDGVPAARNVVSAVRGEFVELQCVVQLPPGADKLEGVTISAGDLAGAGGAKIPAAAFEFFREHYVKMGENWVADILPPITPGAPGLAIPSQPEIAGQRALGVYIDLLVDKATAPGTYTGAITVAAGGEKAVLPLAVVVQDVTLPDELSFVVEMNAYNHSNKLDVFHETYRLLHKHRLSYNVLGYGHVNAGTFTVPKLSRDGAASTPATDLKITDWSKYDEFYGPLFSGEIAKDLPRKGIPATHWYLPFHDGWPWPLSECHPELWKGRVTPKADKTAFDEWTNKLAMNDLPAAAHFTESWRTANNLIGAQFREHFRQKGWNRTQMQVFDNHKYYFASGSLSLWTMDEPQYGRDFHALNTIYDLEKKALAGEGINAIIRGDVSRPELIGDRMDNSSELLVVSSALERYPRMMEDRKITGPTVLWWYGGGGGADTDPCSLTALFQIRWSRGCDGGMPVYTSLAGTNEWNQTDPLRVVRYDPKTGMPVGSFRMKAYRRGQQNMELLNLLSAKPGFSRWHVRDLLTKEFPVKIVTISKGPDDPGYSTFQDLDVARVDLMRSRVVASLLAK